MQQIINALLRNLNLVLYLFLLSFSLVFLSQRSFYHQSQIYRIGVGFSGWLHQSRTSLRQYFELEQTNERLRSENLQLISALLKANDSVSSPLSTNNLLGYKAISAELIQKSYHLPKNIFIANRGRKAGVQKEMGVISSKGVIGIVNQVTNNFTSIMSLLDTDFQINAAFQKNGAFGSLHWTGKDPQAFELLDISIINPVQIGDTIVTGGMSSYFPKGIPLGQVTAYESDRVQGYHNIQVRLFDNPTVLNQVYILNHLGRAEIDSLKSNRP